MLEQQTGCAAAACMDKPLVPVGILLVEFQLKRGQKWLDPFVTAGVLYCTLHVYLKYLFHVGVKVRRAFLFAQPGL